MNYLILVLEFGIYMYQTYFELESIIENKKNETDQKPILFSTSINDGRTLITLENLFYLKTYKVI